MTNPLDKLNLRPFEKRLVAGICLLLFLVVIIWICPRPSDWTDAKDQLEGARQTLVTYQNAIAQKADYEKKIREFESEGAAPVAPDDQANQFLRTVQNQAAVSGVSIMSISRQTTATNVFFLEQRQTFTVQANEEQLVDFLYQLGSGDSIIRARGLSLRPNAPRQQLSGNIDLVASYQKKPAAKTSVPTPLPKKSTTKKP
jgi:Tfp pilus assembly protein PilO